MGKKHRNADLLESVANRSQDAHFPTRTVEQVLIVLSLQQATVGSFYSDLKIAGICGVKKKKSKKKKKITGSSVDKMQ